MMIIRFFLTFFIKAYVVGARLNCDAIQMSTHNICLHKEVKKKYIGCNMKTTEFLDCALIGVCAVIRSNTVFELGHGKVFRSVCMQRRLCSACEVWSGSSFVSYRI